MADSGQLLSDWLIETMREAGMNPSSLERETESRGRKVARSTIDALVKGKRQADPATYERLATAMGVKSPPDLHQVVGGPRLASDAETPRQALGMAKKAIAVAERLLEGWGPIPPPSEEPEQLQAESQEIETQIHEQDEGGHDRQA